MIENSNSSIKQKNIELVKNGHLQTLMGLSIKEAGGFPRKRIADYWKKEIQNYKNAGSGI